MNRRLRGIKETLGMPTDLEDTPDNRVLLMDDLVAIISEIIRLNNTQERADDIDAFYNRRVRLVWRISGSPIPRWPASSRGAIFATACQWLT